jgi:hypothetical protein
MEQLAPLLTKRRPTRKQTSERGELLQFFTDKINADRKGTKYKPLPVAAIAVKLAHLKLADLYYLKSVCGGRGAARQAVRGDVLVELKSISSHNLCCATFH